MSGEFKKEKIGFEELGIIAGGVTVNVSPGAKCRKPETFTILESKREEWEAKGQPKECQYCWHLMNNFGEGYFCNA